MRIAADRELFSLGHLSQQYQQHPRTIEMGLNSIGVEPELSLNGMRYFAILDETDHRLRELFAELAETRRANDKLNKGAKWAVDVPVRENYKPVFHPKVEPAD